MATPQITLTATLSDIGGDNVGSVGAPSKMDIVLCGYGSLLPCIPGTCNIDKVRERIPSIDGEISQSLWGNDQIYPLGTYYQITLLDDRDNVVQAGRFSSTAPAL